jgi:triacylglycerol lipase
VRRILVLAGAVSLLLGGLSCGAASAVPSTSGRAVVVVSGGAAVSPFTTPDQACASGLAAGNTDTALRDHLLAQHHTVYTSPAMAGRGPVTDQSGFGAFGDCPITLPDVMTVDSTGSIDLAGEHLARFLTYLHSEHGVDEVDVVGHSMGGLYSRAAFRVLQQTGSPVRIRSLTTIGTPWQGSYLSDYANDTTPLSDCLGDEFCEQAMTGLKPEVLRLVSGSGREVSQAYLMGGGGWNEFQAGVLDDIPVVVIGGNRFTKPGAVNPTVWPNDGVVETSSELATDISDRVLPHRRCLTFDDTHSIFISELTGLAWDTALTWDPRVLDAVGTAIVDAPGSSSTPTRLGCPPAG